MLTNLLNNGDNLAHATKLAILNRHANVPTHFIRQRLTLARKLNNIARIQAYTLVLQLRGEYKTIEVCQDTLHMEITHD